MKEAFSLKKEKHIEVYIQQHQMELIRLTDHLLSYISEEEKRKVYDISGEENLNNLYKSVYVCLEELITYIEKYFSKYFNQEAKIPNSYNIIAIRDIREKLHSVESSFNAKELHKRLLFLVLLPLKRYIKGKYVDDISFRRLIYLKTLLKELSEWSNSDFEKDDLNQKLICAMVYLNYNSYKFFTLCTEHIKAIYQQEDTLCSQIEKLAWFYKNINQAQEKPGFAYKPKYKSLKDSIIEWIDEEMSFLEKRQQLTLNIAVKPSESLPDDFKLNTKLSVPQLAYLIKIFIESGVLQNRNQREVLKFLAQFVRTKKAESISAESLRTKYYNVEENTKEAVKDILIELLNRIRKGL
ncbi:MAG: hypothetical protein VYB44_06775 [Bacteroidota bacterium]|nr:hypothetical protein [Bacteroidota bacterium]